MVRREERAHAVLLHFEAATAVAAGWPGHDAGRGRTGLGGAGNGLFVANPGGLRLGNRACRGELVLGAESRKLHTIGHDALWRF